MSEVTSRLSSALAGRYRIERELGEGGMATVYLAEDFKHKRKVAVKVFHRRDWSNHHIDAGWVDRHGRAPRIQNHVCHLHRFDTPRSRNESG